MKKLVKVLSQRTTITIVVLLILAVVAIGALKDSNIITHAQKAGSDYTIAQEKEQIGLAVSEYQIQKTITGDTDSLFYDTVKKALEGIADVTPNDDGTLTVTFNKTVNQYKVEKNGTITLIDKELSDPEEPDDPAEKGIVITPTAVTLQKNETATLTATLTGLEETVEWSSSDINIVTVNQEGLVTAVSEGVATITAKCEENTAQATVTVVQWGYVESLDVLACISDAETIIISNGIINATITNVDESGNITPTEATKEVNINEVSQLNFDLCPNLVEIDFNGTLSGDKGELFKESKLKRIVGLEGVTSVSFRSSKNLEYVEIPSSMTDIPEWCFDECNNLDNIEIPMGVLTIPTGCFDSCRNLKNVIIPSSVTTIGNDAFIRCESLTDVTIPENVTTLAHNAFAQCSNLTKITIPASVTSIESGAFGGTSLTQVTINKTKAQVDAEGGIGTSWIPESVTTIIYSDQTVNLNQST